MSSPICQVLQIKRYFYIQRQAFGVIGVDITSQMQVWRRPWLTVITCTVLVTWMISMAHFSVINVDDTDKVTASLAPFLQGLLSIWKVWIFIYNRDDMTALIKRIWMMTTQANDEELKILREENLRENAVSRFYSVVVFITGSAACIPLFVYIYMFFFNPDIIEEHIEKLIPFRMSYFIDPLPPRNYLILYTWCLCGIVFLIYGSLAVDTLFCWYVYNTSAQFRMLRLRIQWAAQEAHPARSEDSIRNFIRLHQGVLENCQELKRIFNLIIFVEFLLNCLQVCFLAYQLGMGVAADNIVFVALFLVSVAVQLMIYCSGGQRIQDESEGVALAIYSSFQWHTISISSKKVLLFAMRRAQKCCNLSGYFFELDLRMFLLVFRNAASYVSLLWSLKE